MVKIKRKEKGVIFKTVNGSNVKLVLNQSARVIRIIILNSPSSSFHKKTIALLIIAVFNFLFLIFHVLNIKIVIAIFVLTLVQLYRLCITIKEERLVAVKHLGLQLTTKYAIGKKTIFIPWEQVQTVFINEVIFKCKIIYILNLLTKDIDEKEKVVPLFLDTLPRLECLSIIYKNLKLLQEETSLY